MVIDGGWLQAKENPVNLFPYACGKRACTGMAKTIGARGASCYWRRFNACTVALAYWHAALSPDGRWTLGNSHRLANKTDSARFDLFLSGSSCCLAWVYQKDAGHAR